MSETNDNVRIGDPDLVFGVTDKTWGYVKNLTVEQGVQKAVAKNGKSQTVGVEYFNRGEKSCNFTYYYKQNVSGPVELVGSGTAIEMEDGTSYHIEKVSKKYAQDDFMAVDCEGLHYPHLVTQSAADESES